MPLWDDPPMTVGIYSLTTARDAGGGQAFTYTLAQSACPCLINTSSASTSLQFAQQNIRVSMTVSFQASDITATLTRGMKLVASDTGLSLKIEGIRQGRAYDDLDMPALVYADCSELL